MAKNEAIEQAKSFYNRLTNLQRGLIFAVVGAVLVGFFLIIFSVTSGKELAVLFNSLEPKESAKIIEKLKERSLYYELKDQGSTILVEKEVVYETRLSLASEGLPESGITGYEIFDKTNLGMSEFVQKLNYRRALEGELAKTIASLDEIKKVRVHLVIPENALFEKDQKNPSASVSIQLKNGKNLAKGSIEGIQNLVSNSVEGLNPGNVTVIDQKGKIISEAPMDERSVSGLTSSQYEQQKKVEQHIMGKVQSLLDGVLGPGNSEVRVNAELDFTQREMNRTDYDPERQVVRSEQAVNEVSSSQDSLSYPAVNMNKNQSNQISNYEISKTEERVINGVGTIKRMTVSALINNSAKITDVEGVKKVEFLPRSDSMMNILTQIIKNAVGFDPARNDQVSVQNVAFDTSILEEEMKDFDVIPWWKNPEYIKLFALMFAMLIAFILMYKLLRSKPLRERIRIAFSLPDKIEIDDQEEEEVDEEELEEIELDENDLLLLPAELPDQLLLEGEHAEMEEEEYDEETESMVDKEGLAERARAKLEEGEGDVTEDALMRLEIKNKVQDFVAVQPNEAIKLVRVLLAQDMDEKIFGIQ